MPKDSTREQRHHESNTKKARLLPDLAFLYSYCSAPILLSRYKPLVQLLVAVLYAGGNAFGVKALLVQQLANAALRDERIGNAQVQSGRMQAHASHLAQHALPSAAGNNAFLDGYHQLRARRFANASASSGFTQRMSTTRTLMPCCSNASAALQA